MSTTYEIATLSLDDEQVLIDGGFHFPFSILHFPMPQTLIHKITHKHSLELDANAELQTGDMVSLVPRHILTHDNTAAVMKKFHSTGAQKLYNPRQVVFALDHDIQNSSPENHSKYSEIQAFAEEMGVDFYPAGRGIGHQVMVEEGYVWPGTFVVASDSHANMYGALGCLGTPLTRSDAAAIWATGKTWWRVPPVSKVELTGALRPGVTGKDVIITLSGLFNEDQVLNHALEFIGEGVSSLSMDARFSICNMSTEWGALAALFPIDGVTFQWLENRAYQVEKRGLAGVASDVEAEEGRHPRLNTDNIAVLKSDFPYADPDAFYEQELTLDLSTVEPSVSGPDHVKVMMPVSKLPEITIQKAYIVSCVNSRVDDLAEAAAFLRGKQVADGVELYVAAASSEVQSDSEARGDWQILKAAGAKFLPPGCGPCIGLGAGLLEDGEVGISATNRNFKGRMGSRNAQCYLASPAVVAASTVAGRIVSPFEMQSVEVRYSILEHPVPQHPARHRSSQASELRRGRPLTSNAERRTAFPQEIHGRALFCPADNLNTDGIFPGKYTYREDMRPEEMADIVMENYDPQFRPILKQDDILLSGFNFGTGSSREQAVTALQAAGIQLVIAGSVSATYLRNAINNGFLVLEVPELVRELQQKFGPDVLTVDTAETIQIDFESATVKFNDNEYPFTPVSEIAQEVVDSGGIEKWVQAELKLNIED